MFCLPRAREHKSLSSTTGNRTHARALTAPRRKNKEEENGGSAAAFRAGRGSAAFVSLSPSLSFCSPPFLSLQFFSPLPPFQGCRKCLVDEHAGTRESRGDPCEWRAARVGIGFAGIFFSCWSPASPFAFSFFFFFFFLFRPLFALSLYQLPPFSLRLSPSLSLSLSRPSALSFHFPPPHQHNQNQKPKNQQTNKTDPADPPPRPLVRLDPQRAQRGHARGGRRLRRRAQEVREGHQGRQGGRRGPDGHRGRRAFVAPASRL